MHTDQICDSGQSGSCHVRSRVREPIPRGSVGSRVQDGRRHGSPWNSKRRIILRPERRKPRPWPPIPNAPVIGCIERVPVHLNSLRRVKPLETWRRLSGGRISAPGKFPGNSREISRKFPANSRKSDYAVILFVRAFPGNFPETFFGFPEKKMLSHRKSFGMCHRKIFLAAAIHFLSNGPRGRSRDPILGTQTFWTASIRRRGQG